MKKKSSSFAKANLEITSPTVRLVNDKGEMLGVVSLEQALEQAQKLGFDLVEISPNSEPPVCKMMDFGRHKYQEKKKMHNARKRQRTVSLKEIKLRPTIGEHDLQIKIKSMNSFILAGDKVKITLRFKGREITHQELGFAVFEKIKLQLTEEAKMEYEPKMEGNQLMMIVVPK
ncbi:MAG: translation initiation factor IF-3 [Rickettsiales bacterium]|nr:translation initiation factor IF-3 [Rickettsiales bacterium]